MKAGFIILMVSMVAVFSAVADGDIFALRNDRMYIDIEPEPLADFLQRFADIGVHVHWDGHETKPVGGRFDGELLEEVFDKILAPASYALTWNLVEGPISGLPQLARMDVYSEGKPGTLRQLSQRGERRIIRPSAGRPYVEGELLVAFRPGTTAADVERLLANVGGVAIEGVEGFGVYLIRTRPDANIPERVAMAAADPRIRYAEPNYAWQGLEPSSGGGAVQWPQVTQYSADGKALLFVMDSGYDTQYIDRSRISGLYDATNPDSLMTDPTGHGTQMALIGSGVITPQGILSPAGREPMPVSVIKTFDEQGYTSNMDLMRGFRHALEEGGQVVNMSWGTDESSTFMELAVGRALQSGLILVAAAGNEPHGRPLYPAAYNGVISVAAAMENGTPWDQSNYGTHVTMLVPGQAEFPIGHNGPAGSYMGTSISSAYVSHALATYMAANPDSGGEEAVKRLLESLSPNPETHSGRYGSGLLDAAALARFLEKGE